MDRTQRKSLPFQYLKVRQDQQGLLVLLDQPDLRGLQDLLVLLDLRLASALRQPQLVLLE